MARTRAKTQTRWGRVGACARILGIGRQSVPTVVKHNGIAVRQLPGLRWRLYDLDAVRALAERSTTTAGTTPGG